VKTRRNTTRIAPGDYVLWPNGKIARISEVRRAKIYVMAQVDGDDDRSFFVSALVQQGAKWIQKSTGDRVYQYLRGRDYRGTKLKGFAIIEGSLFSNLPTDGIQVDEAGRAYMLDHAEQPGHLAKVFGVSPSEVKMYLAKLQKQEVYKGDRLTHSERFYIRNHVGRKTDDIIVRKIGPHKEDATRTYLRSLRGVRSKRVGATT